MHWQLCTLLFLIASGLTCAVSAADDPAPTHIEDIYKSFIEGAAKLKHSLITGEFTGTETLARLAELIKEADAQL